MVAIWGMLFQSHSFKNQNNIRGFMLKSLLTKVLVLVAVLAVASCHTKPKNADSDSEFKVEDQSNDSPYQTVENEKQADDLNKETDAQIQEVEVQDRVLFGYDSSELNDDAQKILDTQAAWLTSDNSIKVTIEGHCDERGTREYNIALGEKRANSAKKYLIDHGVDAARIKIISYGKERPAFFGASEDVMMKNRRAVTVVK